MKTLPEILLGLYNSACPTENVKPGYPPMHMNQALEAIAKELMGCLPEKISGEDDDGYNEAHMHGYNQAISEVRARLTAFIGHKEK